MSLQTAFISMEKISLECTQIGRMIEQHMFNDPLMVFELGTQYVNIIEQRISEYSISHPVHTKETRFTLEENNFFLMKINWIKEMHRQVVNKKKKITSFHMISCYQFLLEITDWYIEKYEENSDENSHIRELRILVKEEKFRMCDPIWQQISKTTIHVKESIIQHQEGLNGITISYKNSSISIPEKKSSIKLQHLGIKGCNHFLKELSHKNIHTLEDLPKQLDGIYLQLTGVGPTTVKKMWNQLIELFSNEVIIPDTLALINVDRVIHFLGESITYSSDLAQFPIQEKDFPSSTKAVESMKENGILTFGDLPEQLLELKKIRGIGQIRIRHLFNQLRELLRHIENRQLLKDLTNDERIHYENERYVEWFLNIKGNNDFMKWEKLPERYIRMLNKRYKAFLTKKHITLQELGDSEGVTRERVRQIINRGNRLVADKWKVYIQFVKDKLVVEGNFLINQQFAFKNLSDYVMIQAFEVEGVYLHELKSMRLLSRMNKNLLNERIEEIKESFHETFDLVTINEATYKMYYKKQAENYHFPEAFVKMLISQWIHWTDNQEGILKNVSKAKIVELVMLNYPNGIAIYKEEPRLNEDANKFMPGKFVSERDFTAVFSREEIADRLLLWARGVYIHKKFVTADESWVRKVQLKASSILLRKEFIHVRKLYESIEEEAEEQQVPNEYALFSMMRLYDEKILSLERFPIIHLLGEKRVDNVQRVIEYIEEQDKGVTKQELMRAFVDNRGWKGFTIDQILSDSPEIIQYKHGVYTLMRYYNHITAKQMKPFFTMLEKMLQEGVAISVHSLFQNQNEVASTLNIDTPHLLYALLKQWNQMDASFDRFPYIMPNSATSESISNAVMIEEMIEEQRSIVTRKEILDWLKTITVSSDTMLDFALSTSEQILYYKRGQHGEYIHRRTIGMDYNEEKKLLVNVEKAYHKVRAKTGKKYMLLQEVYHQIELPKLWNNIQWNDVLLGDLIKGSKKWRVFGPYDEIYMLNNLECKDDIDFIEHLIKTEFNGGISLAALRLYLAEIRYSSTGEFRMFVQRALLNNETPFVLEDGIIVHKNQLKAVRERLKTVQSKLE